MSNVSFIRVLQLNISINVFLIDSTRVIVTGILYAKTLEYCKFLLVQFYSLLLLSTVSLVLWQTLCKEISLPQT